MQIFIIILLGLWDEKIIFSKKKGIMKNNKLQESYCKDPFEGTVCNYTLLKTFQKDRSFRKSKISLVSVFQCINGNASLVYSLRHKTFLVQEDSASLHCL